MEKVLTNEEYQRLTNEYDKVKYPCKCGRRIVIPKWVDKRVCDWCGRYVFKNKEDEFKYRMQERLNKNK